MVDLFTIKKKLFKKKSNLALLAPAGLHRLCSESVFIFVSSFNISTLKSWSVLSIPFVQAGGSWTLRKFSSLFPSGVGNVEESEGLLLMPSGSHSFTSQYHTGLNNSRWICFSWRRVFTKSIYRENILSLGQEERGCYRVKLSLQWVSVRNEGRELNKESRWSDWPSFHKLHQRAQVKNNLSTAKHLILDFSRPILMFRSNKS